MTRSFTQKHFVDFLLLVPLFFLAFISFRHFFQEMYFWHDDYTFLYLVQRGEWFGFPYQVNTLITKYLFYNFGLNHFWYVLLGFLSFLLSITLTYLLIKKLIRNKGLAFLSTAVMASGYTGQDAFKMFVTESSMFVGMNVFLISTISLLNFLEKPGREWYLLAFLTFILTLEINPQRYAGVVIIFIILSLAYARFSFRLRILTAGIFGMGFFIQYFLHPTRFLLSYPIQLAPQNLIGKPLDIFQLQYVKNLTATFWNLFFPSYLQDQIFFSFRDYGAYQQLGLSVFPIFLTALFIFFILWFLRPRKRKNLLIFTSLFLILGVVWGRLVITFPLRLEDIYTFSGGLFILLLALLLSLRIPYSAKACIFFSIISFGLFAIFWVAIPWQVLDSSHRYLMATSFTVPLLLSFFIPREIIFKARPTQRFIAWVFFIVPCIFLTGIHIFAAKETQKEFIINYSRHVKNIYSQIKYHIPQINDTVVVYIDGDTSQLKYAVVDAFRVGALPPETALAVHYNTKMENIVFPDSLDKIIEAAKNKSIKVNNIYTFSYDGNNLKDTSVETRKLFLK